MEGDCIQSVESHEEPLEQISCFPGVFDDGCDTSAHLLNQLYCLLAPCDSCLNSNWHKDVTAGQLPLLCLLVTNRLVSCRPCCCWPVSEVGILFYLRQGGNVSAGFCLFVCLWVREITLKVMDGSFWNFWGYVGHGINYKWLNFGRDPAGILDSGSLWNFRYHCVKKGIREPLQNRRWWRHLANSFALAEVPAGYDCFLVITVFHYPHPHIKWLHNDPAINYSIVAEK